MKEIKRFMETVYVADKESYGSPFFTICKSLIELKLSIILTQTQYDEYEGYKAFDNERQRFNYFNNKYSEELFEKHKHEGEYTLYKVELHEDEEIRFDEYDGQSSFSIVKKVVKYKSTSKQIH
jgi:hypothetical protein